LIEIWNYDEFKTIFYMAGLFSAHQQQRKGEAEDMSMYITKATCAN
jgi:hypothetical protein